MEQSFFASEFVVIPDARGAIRNPGEHEALFCPSVPGSRFASPGMTTEYR
jgi:hypothetical protein